MEFGNIQRVHKRIGDIIRKIEGSPSKLRSHQEQFQKNTESQKPLEISQELTALKGSRNQTTHTLQKGKSNKLFSGYLDGLISDVSNQHKVSPHLTQAVIQAESGGLYNAKSDKGALGLMQLMPSTARQLGVDARNPRQNISGGSSLSETACLIFLSVMCVSFGFWSP